MGISSITAQLVFLREYLALFSGNEFIIAMILFTWMVSGALGCSISLFAEKKHPGLTRPLWALGLLALMLVILSPTQLIIIRYLKDIFFVHGTSSGFYPTVAFTALTLLPYTCVHGFILTFSLRAARSVDPSFPGFRIYICDTLGDVLGGLLFSFVLVFTLTPLAALVVSAIPLSVMALICIRDMNKKAFFAIVILVLTVQATGLFLEKASLAPPFGELALYRESRFGRITVIRDENQQTLFHDNVPVFSSDDKSSAEQAVHYPLSQIAHHEAILLIAAKSGISEEIIKYKPRRVDMVEIDPEITKTLLDYGMISNSPGFSFIHMDARAWLAQTDRTYDAIIVNVSDPETFQANRFFTRDFYQLAEKHLNRGGVFSFSMKGYDSYLAEPLRKKISCLYRTTSSVFPHVLAIPGETIHLICSRNPLDPDIPALLEKKHIPTRFIKGYFHGDVTAERMAHLQSMIIPRFHINTDLRPVLMTLTFSEWLSKHRTNPLWFAAALGVFLVLYLPRLSRQGFLLFTTGFTTMACEILVIFAFQVFFGYIYYQIGLIVTVFLGGLLPGAYLSLKIKGRHALAFSDACFIVLIVLFVLALNLPMVRNHSLFFLVFGGCVSLVCGFQFSKVLEKEHDSHSALGHAFSADLTGAGFGILVTSLILVPFTGLVRSFYIVACLKCLSLVIMLRPGGQSK